MPTKFREFPKIARFSRDCIITEKIDGTNASIFITSGTTVTHPEAIAHRFDATTKAGTVMLAGSRTRWIMTATDNYGFANWARANSEALFGLGEGHHFGEWWGSGIQRGYGLPKGEKRFSLFNVVRWCLHGTTPGRIATADPRIEKYQDVLPPCVGLVPAISGGNFDNISDMAQSAINMLKTAGSLAAPGFMNPEGIVIFHTAANTAFKKTLVKDESPKGVS